jgi:hypothetical protein
MKKQISAIWPRSEPLLLGNLLTFRKELEMLADLHQTDKAVLFFDLPLEQIKSQVPYLEEALKSSLAIELTFSPSLPFVFDWPPRDFPINTWSYGSLKRISLLAQISSQHPILSWPASIQAEAKSYYLQLQKGFAKLITLHLKQQKGGAEESNADFTQWIPFIKRHPQDRFILLGHDEMPKDLCALPNTVLAKQLHLSLATQLALCGASDAFMGMASGICSAAIFSQTPYVIFKHPKHHPEEMAFELGSSKRFTFSKPKQQLWRQLDSLENLTTALISLKESSL